MPTPEPNLDDWPVLPDGVEGVLLFRLPEGYEPTPPGDCTICGKPIAEGSRVFGSLREDGLQHPECWDAAHRAKDGEVDARS